MENNSNTHGCTACKLSAFCGTAGKEGKEVSEALVRKALLFAFALPLALMLMVLAICMALHCSEGPTALLMLGSLVPYYILLRIHQNKIIKT